VQIAFDAGCLQIELAGVPGEDTPVLACRDGVDPAALTFTRG